MSDYTIEPISIADVKMYLSLPLVDTTEDSLLTSLIESCRDQCETYLGRSVAQKSVTVTVESAKTIALPDEPATVISVVQIEDATETTLTGFSILADGKVYIPAADPGCRLVVTYTTALWCPPSVRTAILMAVKNLYMDRQTNPMSKDVIDLLRPYFKRSRV